MVLSVGIRVDASIDIGTGHVMRCLTLADTLKGLGATCTFICRRHPGNLLSLIAQRGHGVIALDAGSGPLPEGAAMTYAAWLGVDWTRDARETRKALGSACLDWLVVDHYALDYRWERALRMCCSRLMVIDDLADRVHDCNLLLDQNLGRSAQDYQGLIDPAASLLIGPRYALLRPEFSQWREFSLARRTRPEVKQMLIAMGGGDKNNVTGKVLDELKRCKIPLDLRITVVMGAFAPWLETVKLQVAQMPFPAGVVVGVSNMAEIMASSDLAIGAAGGGAWERCALGLPSLLMILAENQRSGSAALAEINAAILCASASEISERAMFFTTDKNGKSALQKISNSGAALVDGEGSNRVALAMGATRV